MGLCQQSNLRFFFLITYSACTGLSITTECGKLLVSPGEIVVLPQGFRFVVNLPDGPSRGYVAEIFGAHFQLPDLGPIGTLFLIFWYMDISKSMNIPLFQIKDFNVDYVQVQMVLLLQGISLFP